MTPTFLDTGGQSNDCTLFATADGTVFGGTQFRIANPQTLANGYNGQLLDGTQFNIKLTVANQGQRKDKFFDFVIAGPNGVGPAPAVATDVGVKGGTQTARYNYQASSLGPVTFDGALHATLDNHSNLYNLSNVTFCLAKVIPQATITARCMTTRVLTGALRRRRTRM